MAAETIQGGDYEHTLALLATPPAGLAYQVADLVALSRTVLAGGDYQVAEYSLANHIMLAATGKTLPAIPVFPSRAFRNRAVYVRRDSDLTDPAQLAGRRVGLGEFAMTSAVWTRGHLSDDAGLAPRDPIWVTRRDQRFAIPGGYRVEHVEGDLEAMLERGEIDALMAGKPKDRLRPPAERRLRCIVDDADAVAERHFTATGQFPIMHAIVFHPDLAGEAALHRTVFDGYVAAKAAAAKRRLSAGFLPGAEPLWTAPRLDGVRYGLTDTNRATIATLARYLEEQGLIARAPAVDSLFVAGSAAWHDQLGPSA